MGYCTVRDGLNVMSLLNSFSSCKHMYKLRRLFEELVYRTQMHMILHINFSTVIFFHYFFFRL